ncbi:MAG: hypothetical protein ABSC51_11100 [Gaiellaceae bacterium]|jgi:hypothetical protein
MRRTLLLAVALLVVPLAEPGGGSSSGRYLERVSSAAYGGPIAGCSLKGGCYVRYHDGGELNESFLIRNTGNRRAMLRNVQSDIKSPALLRLVGVQVYKYVPPTGETIQPLQMMRPPYGALAPLKPFVIKAGETVVVQENFRMVGCRVFKPGVKRIYNQSALLTVSVRGLTYKQRIDLTSRVPGMQTLALIVTAPDRSACR